MSLLRELAARAVLVTASVLVALGCLEMGVRLWEGPFWIEHWPNLVRNQLHGSRPDQQLDFVTDPQIGFLPKPGFRSRDVNFDADGFRVTPDLPPGSRVDPPILVTGASFSTSDEVRDEEAWPARFQSLTHRRVINGGVSGFGLDQVVMRTEQLAPALKPGAIVVIVTADGVWRSEMKQLWGAPKPYFTLDKDTLVLRNVPVPPWPSTRQAMSFWQRAFGWSKLAEFVLLRIDMHDEWLSGNRRALPAGAGETLVCPLMRHLSSLTIPTLVVALYEPLVWRDPGNYRTEHRRLSRLMLDCAAKAGLATLDLFDQTDRAVHDRGIDALYLWNHHTAEGNRLVARAIAAEMQRRGMIDAAAPHL